MSDQFPDDLISGFYDGELSSVEREQAQRQLAFSKDARRELEECGRLSELLLDLPRETLSADFADQVLQLAERRTLLPDRKQTVVVPGMRRKAWLSVFVPLATTAAAVLLMLWLAPRFKRGELPEQVHDNRDGLEQDTRLDLALSFNGENGARNGKNGAHIGKNGALPALPGENGAIPVENTAFPPKMSGSSGGIAIPGAAGPELAKLGERGEASAASADAQIAAAAPAKALELKVANGAVAQADQRLAAGVAEAERAPVDAPLNAKPLNANLGSKSGAAAKSAVAARGTTEPQVPMESQAEGVFNLQAAEHLTLLLPDRDRSFPVGKLIDALDTSDGKVAVVRLWVVDRQVGLEKLQLLLTRNKIPREPVSSDEPESAAPTPTYAFGSDAKKQLKTSSDEMVAVYVEATDLQLSGTLDGLLREEAFVELNVQPPITMAAVDNVSQTELAQAVDGIRNRKDFGTLPSLRRSAEIFPKQEGRAESRSLAAQSSQRASAATPALSAPAPVAAKGAAKGTNREKDSVPAETPGELAKTGESAVDAVIADKDSAVLADRSRQLIVNVSPELLKKKDAAKGTRAEKPAERNLGAPQAKRIQKSDASRSEQALRMNSRGVARHAAARHVIFLLQQAPADADVPKPPAPAAPGN